MGGIYWLASYPKSGNTWFRAFLRNLLEDDEAPVDINDLSTGSIASARGWLDEVLGFDTADLSPNEVEQLRPEVYRWALKDEEIQKIAWEEHGFRTGLMGVQNDPKILLVQGIPASITRIVPMPKASVMEKIIEAMSDSK